MNELILDWDTVWANLFLLGLAFILALPVGWNRERVSRSAGLRTYPLVAMASCALLLSLMTFITMAVVPSAKKLISIEAEKD